LKPILRWQYEQIAKCLLLIQGHGANIECPCSSEGEMCLRKHYLELEALCEETLPICDDDNIKQKLFDLAKEARELRADEELKLCGKESKLDTDTADWAREWRKQFEQYSLACEVKQDGRLEDVFTVAVKAIGQKGTREYQALVDTGAEWCTIPERDIKELGVPYFQDIPTETAIGVTPMTYYSGLIEIGGNRAKTLFKAGPRPTIGTKVLQYAGYNVDVANHRLVSIRGELKQDSKLEEFIKAHSPEAKAIIKPDELKKLLADLINKTGAKPYKDIAELPYYGSYQEILGFKEPIPLPVFFTNPTDPTKSLFLIANLDTGSAKSGIPKEMAEILGLGLVGKEDRRLADGTIQEGEIAECLLTIAGITRKSWIWVDVADPIIGYDDMQKRGFLKSPEKFMEIMGKSKVTIASRLEEFINAHSNRRARSNLKELISEQTRLSKMFKVPFEVSATKKGRSIRLSGWVDSGGNLTIIPLGVATKLRLERQTDHELERVWNGTEWVFRPVYSAYTKVLGKGTKDLVWAIPTTPDECVIGAHTLELLLFKVNPVEKKLESTFARHYSARAEYSGNSNLDGFIKAHSDGEADLHSGLTSAIATGIGIATGFRLVDWITRKLKEKEEAKSKLEEFIKKAKLEGATGISVGVANPEQTKLVSLDNVIVDTGSTYSSVTPDVIEKLGLPYKRERVFELADGSKQLGELYLGVINIKGVGWTGEIAKGGVNKIGLDVLEKVGFRVNPVTGQLEEYPVPQY